MGPARVRSLAAEVLAGGDAEAAAPARRAKPGDADAIADLEPARAGAARVHASHDLVTRNDGQPAWGEIALDHMDVRPARRAGRHAHADLSGAGLGHGRVRPGERRGLDGSLSRQDHGAHRFGFSHAPYGLRGRLRPG